MSNAPPARMRRSRRCDDLAGREPARTAAPARAVWCETTAGGGRTPEPVPDAKRCRITPGDGLGRAEAEEDQRPGRRARWLSPSTIRLDRRPIANGIRACASIHAMPKPTPATSVGIWCLPTQTSSRQATACPACRGRRNGAGSRGSRVRSMLKSGTASRLTILATARPWVDSTSASCAGLMLPPLRTSATRRPRAGRGARAAASGAAPAPSARLRVSRASARSHAGSRPR